MKVINFYSGACSSKSTTAATLFSHLKRHNIKAELVGEFAKELIYAGNDTQLVNQVYILGTSYKKMKDLQRYGIDIAISDSPLLLQMVYCQDKPYYKELSALVHKLNSEFVNIDVFVKRVKPYQTYGRVHTEEEAKHFDELIWNAMDGNFHYVINGDTDGAEEICNEILGIADEELLEQF